MSRLFRLKSLAFPGLILAASLALSPTTLRAQAFTPGPCTITADAPAALTTALDALTASITAGNDYGAALGGVLSVEGPGWHYIRAIGMADPDAGRPIDCAMPFEIGSATKMLTATVVLQLAEEGRLGLDDPLSRYLPATAAQLPNGGAITLRQLLQHTSGVFSYTDTAPDGTPGVAVASMGSAAALGRGFSPQEMVDFAITHGQPLFAPGAPGQWAYSNTGYVLLGQVIEAVEQLPLEKVYENRIFTPLGMQHSFLWNGVPRPEFGLSRAWLSPPYTVETTGWNLSQAWAAGGVISTVADMHRFITALVGGKLFAAPETLAQMQATVPSPFPGTEGYGLGLIRLPGGFWGHGGQTLGYISAIGANADRQVSFVVWGNSAGNPIAVIAPDIAAALQAAPAP